MINVNGISKSFGDVVAVNNVSFIVKDGEITGLLGPNGAGKTTTLRMLTCYLRPDRGGIVYDGLGTESDSIAVRKRIGYLPESAPIYADMIVLDYLAFLAEIRGCGAERIRQTAALCGLNEVMHRNISELSKGYKQRVGLAHAMIHDPDVLILDEPTSGLDPNQIIEIRNLIREIGKKKTVILSTHILSEVEATCDRVIIISSGSIVADDRTENLQRARGGEKRISVTVGGTDFGGLSESLKKIGEDMDIRESGEGELVSALVTYRGDRDLRPDIFNMAVRKGWVLYELKQEQVSLEEVFRQLTIGGENGQD
ncbi:MAG: ATP-binding cassette domain-containing protein [Spirochaetes bacterium]|jgi:ABC-2 type transport system ATP-binding protein|nr:ATP-binding cassette domain-containing protein [Spirochaetota bacterium]